MNNYIENEILENSNKKMSINQLDKEYNGDMTRDGNLDIENSNIIDGEDQ